MNFNYFCLIIFLYFFMFLILLFFLNLMIFSLNKVYLIDWEIFTFGSLKVNFPFYFDYMTLIFMLLVVLISSLIILYSLFYMNTDLFKFRFMYILVLFVMSMILFIVSPNLISMILGWDGLGLVSYCLVIHYQNFVSNCSGMLTALTNRLGDCFLIFSICVMINYESWNYMYLLPKKGDFLLGLIILCSMTKSAQIPFSSWLPAAMAAPTPVSSLVHSSTLVTAGVFFLIRFMNYLKQDFFFLNLIVLLGCLTTFMSGICAVFEMDMKKIIALSTLSQLGLMMSSLVVGLKDLVFFHLVMHALFKACLFMCSGNFIHMNFNCQDLRFYGKLSFFSPLIYMYFSISNLCLCGLPFLCGYFSKDLILEMIFLGCFNFFLVFLFFLGVMLTVMYTYRLLKFSMKMSVNFCLNFFFFDKDKLVYISIFPLYFFSIFCGYFYSNLFLVPMNLIVLPLILKIFTLLICLISLILINLVLLFLKKLMILSKKKNLLFEFIETMFFFGFLSKNFGFMFSFNQSLGMSFIFSGGWIEFFLGLRNYSVVLGLFKTKSKNKFSFLNDLMTFFYLILLVIFVFWWMF